MSVVLFGLFEVVLGSMVEWFRVEGFGKVYQGMRKMSDALF